MADGGVGRRARRGGAAKAVEAPAERDTLGRAVLVLQGGGALGAYQAGVYQAMHEAGVEPDWVVGTSIGAINAALIAGNPPERRLAALAEFWTRMRRRAPSPFAAFAPQSARWFDALGLIAGGLPGFFRPNLGAFADPFRRLGPEAAGYYSTAPLRRTLEELVDFDRIAAGALRLTVGAANIATGRMRYFDSRDERIGVEHILASGALPPAFPAVRIDGDLYWDGGVLSNTPVEAVFDDNPRRSSVVFSVHLWRPDGPEPASIREVADREKDLRYASRSESHIARQTQLHALRRVVAQLYGRLPASVAAEPEMRALAAYGCTTHIHVVRLMAPRLPGQDALRDIDFTPEGIAQRWDAGARDMRETLAAEPWRDAHDADAGFVLHEIDGEDAAEPTPQTEIGR